MRILIALVLALATLTAGAASISGTFTYPTKFVDGTNLTLAQIERMRIEYGSCSGSAFGTKQGEVIVNPPATSFTITGLAPGVYCLRAYTRTTAAAGALESDPTNVLSHTLPWPKPEPGTLVTVSTVARLIDGKGRVSIVAGSVPLGTACGEVVNGEWAEVDRDDVKLNLLGRVFRQATIVAKCG
jgi:hypothetical protein